MSEAENNHADSAADVSRNGNGNGNGTATTSKDLLMVSLSRFFSLKNNINRIIPFVSCSSGVSLRLIDWFVTNYSKKHNIILVRTVQSNVMHFNVYLNYRAQLKAYSKQQFDPFRRRDRVMLYYDTNRSVETTVGQLNFFRWMLQNDVLDYVMEHSTEIERDMIAMHKSSSSTAAAAAADAVTAPRSVSPGSHANRKKRVEISQCKATQNMTRLVGARTLLFD